MSPAVNELAEAMAMAQLEMTGAKKDSDNPFFKSKYADLASVRDACLKHMNRFGLSVFQFPRLVAAGDGAWLVEVETLITHKSGQFLRDSLAVPVSRADAQGVGSAISYARRYALGAVAGVAAEDDDGNAAIGGRPPAQAEPRAAHVDSAPLPSASTPGDIVHVVKVTPTPTKKAGIIRHEVAFSDGTKATTIDTKLAKAATLALERGVDVRPLIKPSAYGPNLVGLPSADQDLDGPPLVDDIPF